MLPDIGAVELLIIGVIALVVVGPKDLPRLMREVGRFTAKLRGYAAQFRAQFDAMAREAELDELKKDVRKMKETVDPSGDLKSLSRDLKADIENAGDAPAPAAQKPLGEYEGGAPENDDLEAYAGVRSDGAVPLDGDMTAGQAKTSAKTAKSKKAGAVAKPAATETSDG